MEDSLRLPVKVTFECVFRVKNLVMYMQKSLVSLDSDAGSPGLVGGGVGDCQEIDRASP